MTGSEDVTALRLAGALRLQGRGRSCSVVQEDDARKESDCIAEE